MQRAQGVADNEKKALCLAELDTADDKKKNLDTPISDIENAIVDEEEPIPTRGTQYFKSWRTAQAVCFAAQRKCGRYALGGQTKNTS